MSVKALEEKRAAAAKTAQDIYDRAVADERDLTETERTAFDEAVAEAKTAAESIKQSQLDAETLAQIEASVPIVKVNEPAPTGSIGQQVVDSAQYKAMLAANGGKITESKTRPQMDAVSLDIKAALLTDPGVYPDQVRYGSEPFEIIDLMQAITVVPNAPTTVKTFNATFTNVAADVAEGGTKPEATLTWTPTTVNLDTVAHHIPVTNQTLSHNVLMRSKVDGFLVNGVLARLQAKVAAALNTATGFQAQAFDTNLHRTIRRAVTKAQIGGAQLGAGPASILLNSTDAEALDLEQIANAAYAPGQAPAQVQNIWRTPLIVSPSIPAGNAYVGDLKQVELFLGGDIMVTTGWIDQQFIENKLTILAEVEGAANVLAAGALVKAALA